MVTVRMLRYTDAICLEVVVEVVVDMAGGGGGYGWR